MTPGSNQQPLSEFTRNAEKTFRRARRTRQPQIITENGEASAVLQDARSFEELCRAADRVEMIEALRPAVESMRAGKGVPLALAAERLRRRARSLASRSKRRTR